MRAFAVLLTFLFLAIPAATAQNGVNEFDAEGQRHGVWKKYFPNSKQLRYQGEFDHGKEVGTFKFYCENCKDQPVLVKEFQPDSELASLRYYSPKGVLQSTGQMRGKQKTGKWTYYHKDGTSVMMTEYYIQNKLEGIKTTFYPDGSKTEEVNYIDGKREGESRYYSPAGVEIKLFTFKKDKLSGPVRYYDAKGNLLVKGNYKDDAKHGLWQYYQAGKLVKEERFPKPNGQK